MMFFSKNKFLTLCLSTWAFSTALFFDSIAQAQVNLAPLVLEVQANRGQGQGSISIRNDTDQPFRARVYTEPFTYSRDGGFETLPSSPNDLTPYLQFSPRELSMPPRTTRQVRFVTRFPANLAPGEYRAIIFTENLKETNTSSGKNLISIATRIGSAVYVRNGDVAPKLAVDNASFNAKQKTIQLLVRNSGGATARPKGTWTLKQGETVVKTGKLDATSIVPQSERNIVLDSLGINKAVLPAGAYQLTGELVWDKDSNQKTLPFNVNFTIPAQSSASAR